MFVQTPYRSGQLFGYWYAFPKRGDGIPMHEHQPEAEHNIVVLKGSVLVYGEKGPDYGWRRVLGPGDVFDFDVSAKHEIAALEDNTMIWNLNLRGMPAKYQGLSEADLGGSSDSPLLFPLEGA